MSYTRLKTSRLVVYTFTRNGQRGSIFYINGLNQEVDAWEKGGGDGVHDYHGFLVSIKGFKTHH